MFKQISKLTAAALSALVLSLPMTAPAMAKSPVAVTKNVTTAANKESAATPAATASKKPLPPRDAKGRFIKASGKPETKQADSKKPAATASKKPLPPRDAKGRFIKASPAASTAPAPGKTEKSEKKNKKSK